MMRSSLIIAGTICSLTSLTSATLIDHFDTYTDQAAFQAVWQPYSSNGTSLSLAVGAGRDGSAGVSGVAAVNYSNRSARNLDDFSSYKGTEADPIQFEFWIYDSNPFSSAGNAARNFNELRAYTGDGLPPYSSASSGLQAIIAIGLYNTPVSSANYHARVYGYGGMNAWYNLNTRRSVGWHKLSALMGDQTVKFFVDDVLDTTIALPNQTKVYTFDGVVMGSGLTSGGYNAVFDDLRVGKMSSLAPVPEPLTVILLGLGGVMLRRRPRQS